MRNALSPLARIIVAVIAVFGLVAVALPADAALDNAVGSYRPSSNQTMVLSLTGPAPPTTTTTTPTADPVVPAFTG